MRSNDYLRRYDSLALETSSQELPAYKEAILREIGRGKRVLDLGCLGGQFSKVIKDQNNEVFGVELNPKAAEIAAQKGIRVKTFDLNDGIPFEDGFFDVVNAVEVLEYLYDTKFILSECNRVLKPGGVLVFSVPNLNSISNRLRVLSGGYLSHLGAFPEDHFGEQIRVFNIEKIRELCQHTGFQILEVLGLPSSGKSGVASRVFMPLLRLSPGLGEILIFKARRLDH